MKAVYLEWEDSASHGTRVWVDRDTVAEASVCRCESIGFVLKETKTELTIFGSSDGEKNGAISGNFTIPKSAIRKRRIVRWKK